MSKNNADNKMDDHKKARLGFWLLGLSVLFLLLTYFVYIPKIRKDLGYLNTQYPFLNPAAKLINREDLLVNFQKLRTSLIKQYEVRDDYLISLYFEYLPTGASISLNKDERIWPASLIKIPVAMAAMKRVERGDWQMSNELVIMDNDKDSEFGNLYLQPGGTTMTIKDLFRASLVNSDNTAHFVLLRNIETQDLEDVYNHLGLDEILDTLKRTPADEEPDNRMTSKNYSVFFRSLYNATFLSSEYSQIFLKILSDAPVEHLRKGIPEEVIFSHKTGVRVDQKVWADSGIVYVPQRPYLLTVMMQKKDGTMPPLEEVDKIFTDISREIYNYVAGVR